MIELVASGARTANGGGDPTAVQGLQYADSGVFVLDVTAAAAAAGDKLDVFVQSSADGGKIWNDFIRFTQVLGNGGAKQFQAYWNRTTPPSSLLAAPVDGAMSAGVVQGPIGNLLRTVWLVTDGGAHGQSFTFRVR